MSAARVRVAVPDAAYDVVIGDGILPEVGKLLAEVTESKNVALVVDSSVAEPYGVSVDTALARAGHSVKAFTVPSGETSKSWSIAGELLEGMAQQHLDRTCVVVALGGGVIGDLAGFVSAVYLRGVSFVQVPTTLLAMVDSSVGGKTGVDLAAGKNLAGAFKQPLLVVADTAVLTTLPDAEWQSGLAEVAKTAVLAGDEFMAWLENSADRMVARDPMVVTEAVQRCVHYKAAVVARDEQEEGPRECLNYGHTLGHALEKVLGYGTVTHGAAVAEGMRFAARLSVQLAGADPAFVKRQDRLLDALGLIPMRADARPKVLLDAMRGDKKARAGVIRAVLVRSPGDWLCQGVPDDTMLEHLEALWASREGRDR